MSSAGAVAVIPARIGSERFPRKVLADDTGKALVVHVCEAAMRAETIGRVVVATDDEQVRSVVESAGFEVVMTRADHPNGTSRIAEAARKLGVADDGIVVNVQGDEPEVAAEAIDAAVRGLGEGRGHGLSMGTVAVPTWDVSQAADPMVVKVVRGVDGRALYFSRAPIPCYREGLEAGVMAGGWLRHVGVYTYTPEFLRVYATLEPTQLEEQEKLEQLRVLAHGYAIGVAVVDDAGGGGGIDTREQYRAFVERYHQGSEQSGRRG